VRVASGHTAVYSSVQVVFAGANYIRVGACDTMVVVFDAVRDVLGRASCFNLARLYESTWIVLIFEHNYEVLVISAGHGQLGGVSAESLGHTDALGLWLDVWMCADCKSRVGWDDLHSDGDVVASTSILLLGLNIVFGPGGERDEL